MKKTYLLAALIISVFTFQGCKDKKVIIPPDILSKEVLVPILADLQLAQASVSILEYTDNVHYSLKDYQTEILKKKNISEKQLRNSMQFYSSHPELLQDIYNEVVNELSRIQGEIENGSGIQADSLLKDS